MPILRVRDSNGNFVVVPGIIGPRGPQGQGLSAYDAAKEAGYTGTEEEFNAALADIENKASKATGHTEGNLAALDAEGNPVDSGKKAEDFISQDDLQDAVDDALAQAKESGEFDGEDGQNGVPCTHQWNGTTLIITSASGTSEADLKGNNGNDGKSAYKSAQDGGYTGTEEQFNTDLAEVSSKANADDVVPKAGGTMTGALIAAGGDATVAQVRNIIFGDVALEDGSASDQPEGTLYFSP